MEGIIETYTALLDDAAALGGEQPYQVKMLAARALGVLNARLEPDPLDKGKDIEFAVSEMQTYVNLVGGCTAADFLSDIMAVNPEDHFFREIFDWLIIAAKAREEAVKCRISGNIQDAISHEDYSERALGCASHIAMG